MNLKNEKTEIPCPAGGRAIRTTYGDLSRKSSLKSSKGEYKFNSSDQSKLKRAMDKLEKLQKEFERDYERAQEDFSDFEIPLESKLIDKGILANDKNIKYLHKSNASGSAELRPYFQEDIERLLNQGIEF